MVAVGPAAITSNPFKGYEVASNFQAKNARDISAIQERAEQSVDNGDQYNPLPDLSKKYAQNALAELIMKERIEWMKDLVKGVGQFTDFITG